MGNVADIRGVALAAASRRVVWSSRHARAGGLYSAELHGRRVVTLYEHADCYPDDVVVLEATREVFWTERARGGIMRASLSGLGTCNAV